MSVAPTAVYIRYWKRLFSLPCVWLPFAVGAVSLLSGCPLLWGLGSLAVGAVAVAVTALVDSNKLVLLAKEDVRLDAEWRHLSKLRDLRRRLREDNDPRSSQLVRDLRTAYERLQHLDWFVAEQGKATKTESIRVQSRELYQRCHEALERTYDLWKSARQIGNTSLSDELQVSRADLLDEVSEGLQNLSKTIDFVQSSRLLNTADQADMHQARKELERSLEVARRVQDRLDDLDRELHVRGDNDDEIGNGANNS